MSERVVNMATFGIRDGVAYLTINVLGGGQETFRLTDEAKRRLIMDVAGALCDENAIAKQRYAERISIIAMGN